MTTYYPPLQRQSDRRWDMTRGTGSTPAYAIGYCAGGCGGCDGKGHDTAEEASACYDAWRLDTLLSFHEDPTTQLRCSACGEWTTGLGDLRGDNFVRPVPLCPAHQTREHMAKALDDRKQGRVRGL